MNIDGALSLDPFVWFRDSFTRASRKEDFDASRAALATADEDGKPAVRFVLVKGLDERGFAFFTNYGSRKARHLAARPYAAIAFHWASLGQQVRAEGRVERVSAEESDVYFATRPRGSQLSAWASEQSAVIENREALEAKRDQFEARFRGVDVLPRPDDWGGFRLVPARIEFWRNREDRLHDRWSFSRASEVEPWQLARLQP